MPQSKQLRWSKLRVGLLVLVSLIIFMVAVVLISGEGFLERKYTLRTYMDDAGGLRMGDPVRLAGINAGNVEEIRISGSHDPKRAIEVVMRVRRKYLGEVRANSVALLQSEGLLGQRFIDITRGTPPAPALPPGGEVKLKETPEISEVVATSADVMVKLNRIAARVDNVMAQVESGKGSLGKIIYDESLYQKANRSVDEVQRLVAHAAAGRGSLGKLLTSEELYDNLNSTLRKADGIVEDVRREKGSLGKILYDPGLYNRADQLLANANSVVEGVEKGHGSLGRFVKDEALYNRANTAIANLDRISERLEKGQGSAGRLLNDPALYNNVNTFTQELRTLVADFRQNPKKFLTINFKLF